MYKLDADCPGYRCIAFYMATIGWRKEASWLVIILSLGLESRYAIPINATFVLGNYRALHRDSAFFVIDVAAIISFPICIVHVMDC